jgi:ubiquinone/menaquinone biosynthesis C-methylase UbiE
MSPAIGWDHADTVRYFEMFCRRHARYRSANQALVAQAAVVPGTRILDFAAGTGHTAEAVLPFLGETGCILCVEPALAMKTAGEKRVRDPRISWTQELPGEPAGFDRILCGAAIWQLHPLEVLFHRLAGLLRPGGALCFNIPSLYLGEADEPGGGQDPLLLCLPAILAEKRTAWPSAGQPLPCAARVEDMLQAAGLAPIRWTIRTRLTYAAYRDLLKIPVNTDGMLDGIDADTRAALVDDAFRLVNRSSWRWERWTGWTAWKNGD